MVVVQTADEWRLILYFWWIYTSIPTSSHSQNSRAAAEAPSLKMSSHRTSLKWSRRTTQSAQEKSYVKQWNGASPFDYDWNSMETETKI